MKLPPTFSWLAQWLFQAFLILKRPLVVAIHRPGNLRLGLLVMGLTLGMATPTPGPASEKSPEGRFLYVAVPGVRNYLEYGGHGVLVFDINREHRFVRRIPARGLDAKGAPLNVKGICASATTGRLYVSTLEYLTCFDLRTDAILWEKRYEGGCDRMSISPDGKFIYLPSLEKAHWHVVDGATGDVLAKLVPDSGAHNTIVSLDGQSAFLAGLKSPLLRVADTSKHAIVREVGPFSAPIRPFTINGRATICYVNVNELLGFEVGDLVTGKKLHRVEVPGFKKGPVKRHGCPSHGIGLTPDEKEIWLTDAFNERLHLFDATVEPPKVITSIKLRDQPGWITFSRDGAYAYPSTGEVIDARTRKILVQLTDETGAAVQSEKMIELQFAGGKVIAQGDQFGLGRTR
jgi:hypothetical protein